MPDQEKTPEIKPQAEAPAETGEASPASAGGQAPAPPRETPVATVEAPAPDEPKPEQEREQKPPEPERARIIPVASLEARRIMQLEACTRCGECLNWCPIYDQDGRQDVLPRAKAAEFLSIIKNQHGLLAKIAEGKGDPGAVRKLIGKIFGHRPVTEEQMREFANNLYECSTCGQCQIVCPVGIDTVNLWEEIRKVIVMAGYGPLEPQQALVKSVKSYDNPWQQPRAARNKWARRAKKEKVIADLPPNIRKKGGKVLLYLGCTAAFDTNVRQVAVSTVNILEVLEVDYGVLGDKERCCGSVMLRMGDPEFERIASQNIEQFNSLGIETLITSCAGCFKTIKGDYPKVGKMNFEILHTVEFLARLWDQGKLNFKNPVETLVTYHDPCHLGRASGVYDAPRVIMEALPGLELSEMPRTRQYSRCCGAGGGVKAGFPDLQNKMAQERVKEAQGTGAAELVSCCPFCFQGLQVGINALNSPLVARDLTFLVEKSLLGGQE